MTSHKGGEAPGCRSPRQPGPSGTGQTDPVPLAPGGPTRLKEVLEALIERELEYGRISGFSYPLRTGLQGPYFMGTCPHCRAEDYQKVVHIEVIAEAYCESCGAVSGWWVDEERGRVRLATKLPINRGE